jgi:hypothetical protein
MLGYAERENNSYVQAEIANWLYSRERFDEYDAYLARIASQLRPETIAEIIRNMSGTPPDMRVPAVLDSLGLGKNQPRFMRGVASHSPILLSEIKRAFLDTANPHSLRREMLAALAECRPSDYSSVLISAASLAGNPLITRNLILQYLSSAVSQDEFRNATRTLSLEVGMPLMTVKSLDEQTNELKLLEREILDEIGTSNPRADFLSAGLGLWVKQIKRLGDDATHRSFLDEVIREACSTGLALQDLKYCLWKGDAR